MYCTNDTGSIEEKSTSILMIINSLDPLHTGNWNKILVKNSKLWEYPVHSNVLYLIKYTINCFMAHQHLSESIQKEVLNFIVVTIKSIIMFTFKDVPIKEK